MEYTGIVRDGVIVPDEGVQLPEGARVRVVVEKTDAAKVQSGTSTVGQRLLKHAGTVSGLPADMAEQHDHYLHGTPKR